MNICITNSSAENFMGLFNRVIPSLLSNDSLSAKELIKQLYDKSFDILSKEEGIDSSRLKEVILQHLGLGVVIMNKYISDHPLLSVNGYVKELQDLNLMISNSITKDEKSLQKMFDIFGSMIQKGKQTVQSRENIRYNAISLEWARTTVQLSIYSEKIGYKANITPEEKKYHEDSVNEILSAEDKNLKFKMVRGSEVLDNPKYAIPTNILSTDYVLIPTAEGSDYVFKGQTPIFTFKQFEKDLQETKRAKIEKDLFLAQEQNADVSREEIEESVQKSLNEYLELIENSKKKHASGEDVFFNLNYEKSNKGMIENNRNSISYLSNISNVSSSNITSEKIGKFTSYYLEVGAKAPIELFRKGWISQSDNELEMLLNLIKETDLPLVSKDTNTVWDSSKNSYKDVIKKELGSFFPSSNNYVSINSEEKTVTLFGRTIKFEDLTIEDLKSAAKDRSRDPIVSAEALSRESNVNIFDSVDKVTELGQRYKDANGNVREAVGPRKSYISNSNINSSVNKITDFVDGKLIVEKMPFSQVVIDNTYTVAQLTANGEIKGAGQYVAFIPEYSLTQSEEDELESFFSTSTMLKNLGTNFENQSAEEWFKNNPLSKVIEVLYSKEHSDKGPQFLASYLGKVITMYKGSEGVLLYHEAFHGFWNGILSASERQSITASLKSLPGSFNVTVMGVSKTVNFSEAEPLEIEEFLAEEFRDYATKKSTKLTESNSKIKNFFDKILKAIKDFFNGASYSDMVSLGKHQSIVNGIFKDLYEGNFSIDDFNYEPSIDAKFASFQKGNVSLSIQDTDTFVESVNSLTSFILAEAFSHHSSIPKVKKSLSYLHELMYQEVNSEKYVKYQKALEANNSTIPSGLNYDAFKSLENLQVLAKFIKTTFNKKLKVFKDELALDPENLFLQNRIEFLKKVTKNEIFGNPENIEDYLNEEEPSTLLSLFFKNNPFYIVSNATVEEKVSQRNKDEEERENESTDETKDEVFQVGADQYNSKVHELDALEEQTKFILSSVPMYSMNGIGNVMVNSLGFPKLRTLSEMNYKIMTIAANSIDAIDMNKKLKAVAQGTKNKPGDKEVGHIYKLLGDIEAGNSNVDLWNDFYHSFNKTYVKSIAVIATKISEYEFEDTNEYDDEGEVIKKSVLKSTTLSMNTGQIGNDIQFVKQQWQASFNLLLEKGSPYVETDAEGNNYLDLVYLIKDYTENADNRFVPKNYNGSGEGVVANLNGKTRSDYSNTSYPKAVWDFFSFLGEMGIDVVKDPRIAQAFLYGDNMINVPSGIPNFFLEHLLNRKNKLVTKSQNEDASRVKDDNSLKIYNFNDLFANFTYQDNVGNLKTSNQQNALTNLMKLHYTYSNEFGTFMSYTADGNKSNQMSYHSSLNNMVTIINSAQSYDELISVPGFEHFDIEQNVQAEGYTWLTTMFNLQDKTSENYGKRRNDVSINVKSISGSKLVEEDIYANGNRSTNDAGVSVSDSDETTKYLSDIVLTLNGDQETPRAEAKSTSLSVSGYLYRRLAKETRGGTTLALNYKEAQEIMSKDYKGNHLTDLFLDTLGLELLRFNELENLDFSQKVLFDAAYLNRANKYQFFDDILSNGSKGMKQKLKNLKVQSIAELESILSKDTKLQQQLEQELRDYFIKELKDLENNKFEVSYPKALIDKAVLPNITENEVQTTSRMLFTFLINNTVNALNYSNTFLLDFSNYKVEDEDFHKRIAGLISTGKGFRFDKVWLNHIKGDAFLTTKEYLKKSGKSIDESLLKYDGYIRTGVMKEKLGTSVYSEYYDDYVGIDNKEYNDMEEANGQGWIGFDMYRILSRSTKEWSEAQENLYQKIAKGEPLNAQDIKTTFPVRKFQYYGPIKGTEQNVKLALMGFHKYSLAPLIPTLIEGTPLQKLHEKMMEQGLGYVTMKTGSKLGNVTEISKDGNNYVGKEDVFYNDDRSLNEDIEFTPNIIHARYLKNQLFLAEGYKGTVTLPTQITKISLIGLFDNNVPTDYLKEELKSKNKISRIIESELPAEISNSVTVLDTVPEDILNRNDLFLSLKNILNDKGVYDDTLINWLGINKDRVSIPLNKITRNSDIEFVITQIYNKKSKAESHSQLQKGSPALENFNKWVSALEKYPIAFRDIMLTHAIKYLNPQRKSKYVLQLSEIALRNTYGILMNQPNEANRLGKLYDKEVLSVVSDAISHEPSESGKGYWVHIPKTKSKKANELKIKELEKQLIQIEPLNGKYILYAFGEEGEMLESFDTLKEADEFQGQNSGWFFKEEDTGFEDKTRGSIQNKIKSLRKIINEADNNSTVSEYEKNVELLRKLSPSTWCTATTHTEHYVENYDNYLLIVDGITVAGIEVTERVNGEGKRLVNEVTSRNNNNIASIDHLDDTIAFFNKHNLDLSNPTIVKAIDKKEKNQTDASFEYYTDNDYMDDYDYRAEFEQEREQEYWDEMSDDSGFEEAHNAYWENFNAVAEQVNLLRTVEETIAFFNDRTSVYRDHFKDLSEDLKSNETLARKAVEADSYNLLLVDTNLPFYLDLAETAVYKNYYTYDSLPAQVKENEKIKEIYNERLLNDADALPFSKTNNNLIQGYYDSFNDKVVVIASNVSEKEASKVAIHEVAHRGMLRMAKELGGTVELENALLSAEKELMEKLPKLLKRTGHKNLKALMLDYGFSNKSKEGKIKLLSELAARWAETLIDKPKPTWWKNLSNLIGKWITKFTGKVLSEKEVDELIGGFVKYGTKDNKKIVNRKESWEALSELEKRAKSKHYDWYVRYQNVFNGKIPAFLKAELLEDLGLTLNSETGLYEGDDKKLIKYIKAQLLDKDLIEEEIMSIIDPSTGKLIKDLSFSAHASAIEKLLTILVDKRLRKMKINGEALVQVSGSMYESLGVEGVEAVKTNDDKIRYGSNQLRFYHAIDKDGNPVTEKDKAGNAVKVNTMEVMISLQGSYKSLLQLKHSDGKRIAVYENNELNYNLSLERLNEMMEDDKFRKENESVLTFAGIRIPTQGPNALSIPTIKKFLPEFAGPVVILPIEIVAQSGSDFDIDKIFSMMKNIAVYNGKAEVIKHMPNVIESVTELKEQKKKIVEKIKSLSEDIEFYENNSKTFLPEYEKIENKIELDVRKDLNIDKSISEVRKEILSDIDKAERGVGKFRNLSDSEISDVLEVLDENLYVIENAIEERTEAIRAKLFDLYGTERITNLFKANDALIIKAKSEIKELNKSKSEIFRKINGKSIKGLQNEFIDLLIERGTMVTNFKDLITANTTKDAKGMANEILKQREKSPLDSEFNKRKKTNSLSSKVSPTKAMMYQYNLYKHQENFVGMDSLGIAAVVSTFQAMFTITDGSLQQNEPKEDKAFANAKELLMNYSKATSEEKKKFNEATIKDAKEIVQNHIQKSVMLLANKNSEGLNYFGSITAQDGKNISDLISQMINGYVDVAKDAWVFLIEGSKENTPVLLTMIMLGVPFSDAVRISTHPLVRKYNSYKKMFKGPYANLNSEVSITQSGSINVRALAEMEYYRDEFPGMKGLGFNEINNMNPEMFLSGEIETLSQTQLIESDKPNYITERDIQLFAQYLHLESISNEMTTVTGLTKFDTQKMSTVNDVKKRMEDTKTYRSRKVSDKFFGNKFIDYMQKESIVSSKNNDEFISKLFSKQFGVRNNDLLTEMSLKIRKKDIPKGMDLANARTHFKNDFIWFLYQNSVYSGDTVSIVGTAGQPDVYSYKKHGSAEIKIEDGIIYYNPANSFNDEIQKAEYNYVRKYFSNPLFPEGAQGNNIKLLISYKLTYEKLLDDVKLPIEEFNKKYFLFDKRGVSMADNFTSEDAFKRFILQRAALFLSKNPVAMFDSEIGIVPLINNLVSEYPELEHYSLISNMRYDNKKSKRGSALKGKYNIFYPNLNSDPNILKRYKENLKMLGNHKSEWVKQIFNESTFTHYALMQTGQSRNVKNDFVRIGNARHLQNEFFNSEVYSKIVNTLNQAQIVKKENIENKVEDNEEYLVLTQYFEMFSKLLKQGLYNSRYSGINYILSELDFVSTVNESDKVLDVKARFVPLEQAKYNSDNFIVAYSNNQLESFVKGLGNMGSAFVLLPDTRILMQNEFAQNELDSLLNKYLNIDNTGDNPKLIKRTVFNMSESSLNLGPVLNAIKTDVSQKRYSVMASNANKAVGLKTKFLSSTYKSSISNLIDAIKQEPTLSSNFNNSEFSEDDVVWLFGDMSIVKESFAGYTKAEHDEVVKQSFESHKPMLDKIISSKAKAIVSAIEGFDTMAKDYFLINGYYSKTIYKNGIKYYEMIHESKSPYLRTTKISNSDPLGDLVQKVRKNHLTEFNNTADEDKIKFLRTVAVNIASNDSRTFDNKRYIEFIRTEVLRLGDSVEINQGEFNEYFEQMLLGWKESLRKVQSENLDSQNSFLQSVSNVDTKNITFDKLIEFNETERENILNTFMKMFPGKYESKEKLIEAINDSLKKDFIESMKALNKIKNC